MKGRCGEKRLREGNQPTGNGQPAQAFIVALSVRSAWSMVRSRWLGEKPPRGICGNLGLVCMSRASWAFARRWALRFDARRAMSWKLPATMRVSAMTDTAFIPIPIAKFAEPFRGNYENQGAAYRLVFHRTRKHPANPSAPTASQKRTGFESLSSHPYLAHTQPVKAACTANSIATKPRIMVA